MYCWLAYYNGEGFSELYGADGFLYRPFFFSNLQNTILIRNSKKTLGQTIPIIAMTANAFSEDVQQSMAAGMDAHISKPIDMALLEKTIRGLKDRGVN